jgi:hypothetical protein
MGKHDSSSIAPGLVPVKRRNRRTPAFGLTAAGLTSISWTVDQSYLFLTETQRPQRLRREGRVGYSAVQILSSHPISVPSVPLCEVGDYRPSHAHRSILLPARRGPGIAGVRHRKWVDQVLLHGNLPALLNAGGRRKIFRQRGPKGRPAGRGSRGREGERVRGR